MIAPNRICTRHAIHWAAIAATPIPAINNSGPTDMIRSSPARSGATTGAARREPSPQTCKRIGYTLYQDSSFQTVWGSTAGTNTNDSTGTGAAQSYTVYGKVTSSLNVPAGNYSDTVTIDVTY